MGLESAESGLAFNQGASCASAEAASNDTRTPYNADHDLGAYCGLLIGVSVALCTERPRFACGASYGRREPAETGAACSGCDAWSLFAAGGLEFMAFGTIRPVRWASKAPELRP